MKSSDRCKANSKGDRCIKARGHQSDLNISEPDRLHQGNNLVWRDGCPPMPIITPAGPLDKFSAAMEQVLDRADRIDHGDKISKDHANMLRKYVIEQYAKVGIKI